MAEGRSLNRSHEMPAWSRMMRGGRMTKWKGVAASYAPNLAELVPSIAGRTLPILLAAGLTVGSATAADRYWDSNATTPGHGGTGTWNLTSQIWSPSNDGVSGPYAVWNNGALDDAIFGGTAGTVTLANPITVHNMTFTSAGYILTGGTLTLGGADPTISTIGSTIGTTIDSIIAGSAGLIKNGAGTLTLNGANTFTGDIFLNAGSLDLNGDAALGAAANRLVTADGTYLDSTGALGANRIVSLGSGFTNLTGAGVGSARFTGTGGISARNGVTLNNDGSDFTGQTTFFVNGDAYFTSVGDLGEASSLGAGNAANEPIRFTAVNQYSDWLHYTGDGDSSNRNWEFATSGATSGAVFLNNGTGALTLTGDIFADISTNRIMVFVAEDADLNLLGEISSSTDVTMDFRGGGINRIVTLGDANTYSGATTIGLDGLGATGPVTVRAGVLTDAGIDSSFGTGTAGGTGIYNGSVLSYTGTGSSSNRDWTIGEVFSGGTYGGAISNDGSGALSLSGAVTFAPDVETGLLLGGSYTGVNTLSGVISGDGSLGSSGSGTWVLTGANTRTGALIVDGGTLRANSASAFGTTTAVTVNGGTLDLDGHDLTTLALNGTGGEIALGTATLTVDTADSTSYAGSITGAGGLTKSGNGTLTLSGTNSYTGDTSLSGGGITLDFTAGGAPASDIIAADSTLNMAGGMLTLIGADGVASNQTFDGLNISAGSNRIAATSGSGGSMTVDLGAITRTGGLVDFVLPTSGDFLTSSASLGGWATVNGSDYAKVVGNVITAFEAADYANKDDAASWLTGEIISDAGGAADSPFFGVVSGSQQLGGLKYTAAADSTVDVAAGETLGIDGTIIVASSVGATDQTITGGSLTGGASGGALGVLQNGGARFTIGSTIVDNGGATGFTKGGEGIVRLTGSNTYTGATTLSGGELQITSLADAGQASGIGAASADSSNLVLESGTLHYVGGADSSTDRGFTLVNGGATAPTIQVDAGRTIEFSGLVTSPDDAGLTKTGWGTLILSNAANDYVGVTTVAAGGGSSTSTLSVNTLADGGAVSGIGAASSDSSNLVLSDGGRLQYTGTTTTTDRGFTLASGNGGIDVSEAATTLTVSGTAVGAGNFVKSGAGTLVLSGDNTYSGNTQVTDGTLRAGSATAFGEPGFRYMIVEAGATFDLGGFDISGGGVTNAGTIDLGANTLTTAGGSAVFTGRITGSGGFTRGAGGYTQTLNGCNSDYTGVTTIAGLVSVDCLADGGVASSIGAASADSSNLVLAGGSLTYTGNDVAIDRGFTLQSGVSSINVDNAGTTLEISGQATGAGLLHKGGAGTLILSGDNNYTGHNSVAMGILRAGSNTAFGTGTSQMSLADTAGVALDLGGYDISVGRLNGGGAVGGDVLLGANTLTLNNGSATYGGTISGTGGIVKNGAGSQTQALSGCASDYTGSTVINGGILSVSCLTDGGTVSSIGASSGDASNLVINGGTLTYVGTGSSTNRQFTLGASNGSGIYASGTGAVAFTSNAPIAFSASNTAQRLTLAGTNTDNNVLAAQITNNGTGVTSFTKAGPGTWILTNPASTYTGVTTIGGGVLGVDKLSDGGVASSIGASSAAASNLVIGNNSTLRYTGTGDTTNRLFTLAAGTTFIESSGTGAIVFTDTGPVTLAGNNQARTIALGGTNTGNNTLAGAIGDAGTGVTTLAKNDSGNWILTGNNTFSGNTVINDGNLTIGNGGTTGNAGTGNVFVTSATSTLSFNRSDTFNFTGTISGVGGIAQIGSGTTVLTATNSIGAARVDDGTLQVDGALGTATFAMNGDGALVVNGTVEGAAAGSVSTFTGDAGATAIAVNAGGTLRASGDLGGGSDTITLAGILDTGATALNLGDGDDVFTLNDGGAISGSGIDAGAGTDSLIVDNALARILNGASVSSFESLAKQNNGVLTLTGDHSYSDGTTIAAGTLRIGNGGVSGTLAGDIANNGVLEFDRSGTLTVAGEISGSGSVDQLGSGTTVLTANNTYTGGTTISDGTLQLGDGGTSGGIVGDVANNGTLAINRSNGVTLDGLISGSGGFNQIGMGTTTLSGDNSYTGATNVDAGTLFVNGDQSAATGLTSVASGATLGGTGIIGGNVAMVNGAVLAAGANGVGTLTINGDLDLSSGTVLDFEFGQADVVGGALNDLVNVGGNLTLAGTVNVSVPTGGGFDAGIYRMFNYAGTLDDQGLALGTMPSGSDVVIQTSVAGQVNLINSAGLLLNFWDGDAGPKFDDNVNGGDGTWQNSTGNNNWTNPGGSINAAYADGGFAVFMGAAGTVTVDNGLGAISASGMQFASGGYVIAGGDIALVGPESTIRVGDGTAAGAAMTATIASNLTGTTQLVKTDDGTLVLTGANTYTGGTAINGGTLQIGNGGTTGSIQGGVVNNGTLALNRSDVVTFGGEITGTGGLNQLGTGTTILTADNAYTGGTTVSAGILQIGNGGTSGSIVGDVVNNNGLVFNRSDDTSFAGAITGTGSLTQTGGGVLRLTGDSDLNGTTLIDSSELRLENGGSLNSGTTILAGPDATLTVTGAGSSLTTAQLVIGTGSGGAAALNIENGGQVTATGTSQLNLGVFASPGNPASVATVNVSGPGSMWDVGGNVTVGFMGQASATVNVTDGGTVRSNGLTLGPIYQSMTNPSDVTISGAGSNWTTTADLTVAKGTLTLLDGGRLDAATGRVTAASATQDGQGRVLVSGAGSELAIADTFSIGGVAKEAIVTVSDGGQLSAGGLLTLAGVAAGSGSLNIGAAAGDTAAVAGTVDVADIAFGPGTGTINFNHTNTVYDFGSAMTGAGAINQLSGTTVLSGDSAGFSGLTSVSGGALYVNNALGGDIDVATGGTLGGIGTIGGNVVADGVINPGDLGATPGTLSIDGNLSLAGTSTLNYNFGQAGVAGGAFNDLINVGGDLALDGTLNVVTSAGGSFDPGVYRVINYAGNLTADNGLELGTIPSPDFYVQTSVPGQVNLVNTAGMTLRYWDGETIASKNSGTIEGGDGVWQNFAGNDNWTEQTGAANAPFTDAAFAVFTGAAGTVSVDESLGEINASGMQFLTDGYVIEGSEINLAGATSSVIRVGDGTLGGAAITATIDSVLTGGSQLAKADLGTLILTGDNTYTGGTTVNGGTLLVNGDQSAASGLTSVGSATLGGTGIIGGDVEIAGGTIAPGSNGVGTLTVRGNMALDAGSTLAMEFGEADTVGGTLNDLIEVEGNLVLDGTIDVSEPAGGSFDTGIYRVFNYGGELTDNGLELGAMPAGSAAVVQTSVEGQVNLINTSGLFLNFWDGAAGPKFDGVINGGDGVWQSGSGNNNWTDGTGALNAPYQNGGFAVFAGAPGTVTVDNSVGQVTASGMQFASGGYTITGGGLELVGPQATIRVGDGTDAGSGFIATISSEISGASELVKTDLGTLVLTESNTYTGGTSINSGVLQVAADTALGDAAGELSFSGGALRTTADMTSDRSITLTGDGTLLTDEATTLTLAGQLSGAGEMTKDGAGTLLITADNSSYLGNSEVKGGTLAVDGILGGEVDVEAGGQLEGDGRVGSVTNAGIVGPGRSIGTLTITGDYVGNGGVLEIETVLGGDNSQTDLLAVNGNTSGTTTVNVINRDGLGAQTQEGIKIIDVAGDSDGTVTLNGDYLFEGEQAVVAGAYGYRLYQNGVTDPTDGDWYLRSALLDPVDPGPLYQPGVPIYESYAGSLQQFNKLGTLQQRVGNRQWSARVQEDTKQGRVIDTSGIWARIEAAHADLGPDGSTTGASYDASTWKFQAGVDSLMLENETGQLVGGVNLQYGTVSSSVWSPYGVGVIDTIGYGVGATLTWYGENGFYADGQAQLNWYDSDLHSSTAGRRLVSGNDGMGYALSIEAGQRLALTENWSLTPQVQLAYSSVDFDNFTDTFGAAVSLGSSDSLFGRFGLAVNHDTEWLEQDGTTNRAHLYGVANVYYDFDGESNVDVAGTGFISGDNQLYGEVGIGGSLNWADDRYSVFGEANFSTNLENIGDNNAIGGTFGFRMRW